MVNYKEKNFISAVIYVHNNETEIESVLKSINSTLKKIFNKYEIICVNDASTDNSTRIIQKYAERLEGEVLSIINMSYFQGTELAMNAGIDLAIGDFVYEFDNISAYQIYKEDLIIELYKKCLEGYDIVSATPNKNSSKLASLFYKVFNTQSNLEYKIHTETFRILSRRAINRVHSIAKNIPYRKAVYASCGLKVYTVVYNTRKKQKPELNKTAKEIKRELAINSLILFTKIGYKISVAMSIAMMISIILVVIYTISISIEKHPTEGWTTLMLFLAFGFFGLFLIMAIIIKYLEIILSLIFKKNNYIIESIEKLN